MRKHELITTKELAKLFKMSHRSIEQWRYRGQGPAYIKLNSGNVRYYVEDVINYERAHEILR